MLHEVRVVGFGGGSLGLLSSRFAHDVVLLLAAGACLWRAASVRVERTAWLLIALGVLAWTFGEICYTVVLWDESSPPIPSPADIGYLAFPPFTSAGMIVLLRGRTKFTPARVVDGIAAALAVAGLSAAIVFQTALEYASGDPIAVATNLSYPIADLFRAPPRKRSTPLHGGTTPRGGCAGGLGSQAVGASSGSPLALGSGPHGRWYRHAEADPPV